MGFAMNFAQKLKPGFRDVPPETSMKDWRVLLATWFGTGRLRPGPGTMGSIAAIPFGFLIAQASGPLGLAMAALSLLCIGTVAADFYGRKSGKVDDQTIVVDEVVGMWIAAIPAETNWELWSIAFILFRLFDITKPWPASFFDGRSIGGIDVMMDDVIAAIYAFFGTGAFALAYL
jgi:phosphatidylglycerophosphatase A